MMKKKTLRKDTIRTLTHSWGRFFSIFGLVALGTFALIGLKATGPNMRETGNTQFDANNLADVQILSNYGFDTSDVTLLENVDTIDTVEFGYLKDTVIDQTTTSIRLFSNTEEVSTFELIDGRLPNANDELALDAQYRDTYPINTTLMVDDMGGLKQTTFTIVGYVQSSEMIDNTMRGTTRVGTGELNTFAVLDEEAFSLDVFTLARVRFDDTKNLNAFDSSYSEAVDKNTQALETLLEEQAINRSNTLQNLDITYTVHNRNDFPGYTLFDDNTHRTDILAMIFPTFLFAIAALVCLTTMTRMVDEQRINSGTLKALGYSNKDIRFKFIFYGIIASASGSLVGVLAGHTILPTLIYNASTANFAMPDLQLHFYLLYTIVALFISIFCTVGVALLVVNKELQDRPSVLLLPKAPKNGSTILLERIPFIWKRLSFNSKVTARNLFRYKQRMFMTILGVTGCTALLISGFGLRDSIQGIVQRQFSEIVHYDMIAVQGESSTSQLSTDVQNAINQDDNISSYDALHLKSVYALDNNKVKVKDIQVMAIDNVATFTNFISLYDAQTKDAIQLDDEGVVITQKMATLLNIKVGDTLQVYNDADIKYEIKVVAISEMYVGHTIYMTKTQYEKIFAQDYAYNAHLITLNNKEDQNQVASNLMQLSGIKSIQTNDQISSSINAVIVGLDKVIIVLLICATILAMIVIFNLTNINISERIRELSTIKVLGFYPEEVTMYIYRETIILSILGITVGFLVGTLLHSLMIVNLAPTNVMFYQSIVWTNLALSASITLAITFVIMIIMHIKLLRVNMLDALKSVD